MHERLGQAAGFEDEISARDVLEAAPDALLIVNDAGTILRVNAAAERLFGYDRAELIGRPVEALVAVRNRPALRRYRPAFESEPAAPRRIEPEMNGLRKDGAEFPAEVTFSPLATGRGKFLIAAIRDLSVGKRAEEERRRLARERALYAEVSLLARKDSLTGLPNRAMLHDRVATAIASAERHGHRLAVLFLDIDRFKLMNDSLGHAVGDWLLESLAVRLTGSVRGIDTVSRQGGDEFVILLSEIQSREEAAALAAKILASASGAHRVAGHQVHVTVSMGVAMYPEDGTDSETLIKNADIAMYHAKDHARSIQFFSEEMNARLVEGQALEGSLRRALDRGEFVLYYQPKVSLESGRLIGAEALLRWQHPERGLVAPEHFVPVAEDSGLIVAIGQWVLREACRQSVEWQDAGLEAVPIAVNISAIEFRNEHFLDNVRRILRETGVEPRLLELELTESVLMESVGATATVLSELKAMGLRLAVDDFGTGYSSLSYLTRLPIDALKVDQSFLRDITTDEGSPIVTAVISMGRSLKHRVIAEGVETPAQLAFLRAQQCEEGQGFHFSRPLAASQFAALLARKQL